MNQQSKDKGMSIFKMGPDKQVEISYLNLGIAYR